MSALAAWLGVAFGAIAIAVTVWIALFQRQRKMLDWIALSDTSLVSPHRESLDALEVYYQGERLENPRVVRVRLINTGNKEIDADDFLTGPGFTFGEVKVVDVAVVRQSSPDIYEFPVPWLLDVESNTVILPKRVQNAGEWVDLQFVIDGEAGWPFLDARMRGQSRAPKRRSEDDLEPWYGRPWNMVLIAGASTVPVAIILSLFDNPSPAKHQQTWPLLVLGFVTLAFGAVVCSFGMVRTMRWVNRYKRKGYAAEDR